LLTNGAVEKTRLSAKFKIWFRNGWSASGWGGSILTVVSQRLFTVGKIVPAPSHSWSPGSYVCGAVIESVCVDSATT
jgi:hypothetical protein